MPDDVFWPIFKAHRSTLFAHDFSVNLNAHCKPVSDQAAQYAQGPLDALYHLNILVYHKNEVAGWVWGRQIDKDNFYLVNAAVFPAHRRKGLYTRLLAHLIAKVSGMGFLVITSRHVLTNNAVLIPMLKAGFVITGMELNPAFGMIANTTYFCSPLARKVADFRAGQVAPDAELRDLFGLV